MFEVESLETSWTESDTIPRKPRWPHWRPWMAWQTTSWCTLHGSRTTHTTVCKASGSSWLDLIPKSQDGSLQRAGPHVLRLFVCFWICIRICTRTCMNDDPISLSLYNNGLCIHISKLTYMCISTVCIYICIRTHRARCTIYVKCYVHAVLCLVLCMFYSIYVYIYR